MPDVPPGFLLDLLRLVAFMAVVGVVTVVARRTLLRYARRRKLGALAGFVHSPPGTFLLVTLSFALCLLVFLAVW